MFEYKVVFSASARNMESLAMFVVLLVRRA